MAIGDVKGKDATDQVLGQSVKSDVDAKEKSCCLGVDVVQEGTSDLSSKVHTSRYLGRYWAYMVW